MKTQNTMAKRISSLKSRNEEGADIVQTLLILAGMVVICIIVLNLVMGAVTEQAEGASDCIKNAHKLNNNGCKDYAG